MVKIGILFIWLLDCSFVRHAFFVISLCFSLQDEPLGMSSLTKGIADIFAESESDQTFYGFSDSEIGELCDVKVNHNCCICCLACLAIVTKLLHVISEAV